VVLDYQAKDFGGRSPAIVVTSAASERQRATLRGSTATFAFNLHLFVAFAQDGEEGYTDADAEALLDQVELEIAQFVDTHQRSAAWHALAYAEPTDAGAPAEIGSVEYRHELIALAVSVSA
jgi:hypothetical protein